MSYQNISDKVVLVDLPHNTALMAEELKQINDMVSAGGDFDVIVDFFKVEIVNSSCISNFLILLNLLADRGHSLVFCNVSTMTSCIFTVAGLKDIFTFVDDKNAALAALSRTRAPQAAD